MKTIVPLLALGMAACAPVFGAPAGSVGPAGAPLDAIFDQPELAHAHIGVEIRSLETGETIYARNADRLFIPASNVKLMTGAAALETLGPDYRFATTVAAGGPVQDGVLDGPLVVTGTGDPTFSSRFLEDARDAFRLWADSLRAHGVTRILGGVIAVDTAFAGPTLGNGWMWDDLADPSSAEFGALQFNEGVISLDVFPSQNVLEPAIVVLDPPTQYVRIINDARTMSAGSMTALRITRDDAGSTIIVRGEVAADGGGVTEVVSVRNPALYFASALRETLREQGITVEGPAVHFSEIGLFDPAINGAFTLFTHESPPLAEVLTAMMKESQNQIAETLLKAVGREARGEGSAEAGIAAIDSLLVAWEIGNQPMRMVDGSGLSRYNLLSPDLLTDLLAVMAQSPNAAVFRDALPVAGQDGTLENRMGDPPLAGNVRAKTGTLSNTRALSGYLTTTSGAQLAFSAIVNGNVAGAAAADAAVEAALAAVAAEF